MDWLALAVLGIIWGVLLRPASSKRESPSPLRRSMSLEEEEFRHPGRWILSPRRGSKFVGRRQRARLRARDRRRRVYLFLLEVIGVTGLIGMFPPLRGMLVVTAFFAVLLAAYTVMVVWSGRSGPEPRPIPSEGVDLLVVLPNTDPDRFLEEQDRRVVHVAAR
jgi:hypothetical protein